MDDITKSIKANLYDRSVSPLSGAFLISWLGWNYKLIVVLLSSMDVTSKFRYIEGTLYNDLKTTFLIGFFWPLVSACVLIFLLPYPAACAYDFSRKRRKILRIIKAKYDDETPITGSEARELRRKHRDIEARYENELKELRIENQDLKDEIRSNKNELSVDLNIPKNGIEANLYDLSAGERALIVGMGNSNETFTFSEVQSVLKRTANSTKAILERMIALRFIKEKGLDSDPRYELAELGKKIRIEILNS